jgi:hypothetical protein
MSYRSLRDETDADERAKSCGFTVGLIERSV